MPQTFYFAKINTNREIFGPIVKARKKPVGNFTQIFYEPCCLNSYTTTTTVLAAGIATVTATGGDFINVDWGDGATATRVPTTAPVKHAYVLAGTYTVKISVSDSKTNPLTALAIAPGGSIPVKSTQLVTAVEESVEELVEGEAEEEPKPKKANGRKKKDEE